MQKGIKFGARNLKNYKFHMKTYTEEEIQKVLAEIATMDHYTMCRLWRFAPIGEENIYFRNDLPTGEAFCFRLFKHFGGFTPEISKSLNAQHGKD